MFARALLSDHQTGQLADAVLTVLDKLGVRLQSGELLEAVEATGARVDYAREVATFPREGVLEFVETLRRAAPGDDDSAHHSFSAPGTGRLFHQLSQYCYDCAKRERRLGNRDDYVRLLKFGEALHAEEGVGHCLLLSDVPAPIEPLVATLLQFEHVSRPTGAYVQDIRQISYLEEMEELSGIPDLHWLANVGFSSPLRLGEDVAERLVHALKHDRPNATYIMTVSGAGTPATVAGTVVVAAAELLALWMTGRALNPECSLSAGAWIATMDMRSGEASYSAPDALIRNLAIREFLRRWTGMTIGCGGGSYSPAKTPGLMAAMENAWAGMTIAAFTGSHPGVVSGHLDGGLTISPEQFLLERELADALGHLATPIEVTGESLALDTILAVGHAEHGNYLQTDHTLRNFRSSLWLPELMGRAGWTGAETEEQVLRRAQAKVDEVTASYQQPDVDEDMLAKLREVVMRAERNLCS